jgi:hypothetical protein
MSLERIKSDIESYIHQQTRCPEHIVLQKVIEDVSGIEKSIAKFMNSLPKDIEQRINWINLHLNHKLQKSHDYQDEISECNICNIEIKCSFLLSNGRAFSMTMKFTYFMKLDNMKPYKTMHAHNNEFKLNWSDPISGDDLNRLKVKLKLWNEMSVIEYLRSIYY